MKFLLESSFPLEYEFRVLTDPLAIRLSISPHALDFFRNVVSKRESRFQEQGKPFLISQDVFGYDGILKECEPHPRLPDFPTYSFLIPRGIQEVRKLELFSRTISDFAILMSLCEVSVTDVGPGRWKQLMIFDFIGHPNGDMGTAGFAFTYASEVLDFNGTRLWTDANVEAVLGIMRESYFTTLSIGKRERRNYEPGGFHFGPCYGSEEFIHLRVPGDCACIGTYEERIPGCGHRFSPHNIDSYFQQIPLMMGVIKIANLAREALNGTNT